MTRLTLLLLTLTTLPARAEEWAPLDTAGITAALTERTYAYEGATQTFYASGRTFYEAGRPSWGYWRAEGDQYCSQWPPGDLWTCYDMTASGDRIRFVAADGSFTEGWPAE